MCGIAGIVDANRVIDRADVEKQLRLLDHRGPDSGGIFPGSGAVIGQTRLAIIDLVTGDPPITNEDGSVGVSLNGEIYNYAELRERLKRSGHELATTGDTEVIAHLAEDLEPVELARALEGMFAFAVWDERRGRLILGRDRPGKKPLYYWHEAGRLVFASEIKALLADERVPRRLNRRAIPAYLTFGYAPTPHTFFEGVMSVPPGHVLVFDEDGLRLEPYWSPSGASSNGRAAPGRMDDAAREVRSLLDSAVRRRMIADVPLGAFLSGGIDSATVVALMAGVSERPVKTFTIGFDEDTGLDERPYASMVAKRFKTDHTEFVVRPHAVDLVERLVWHHDQPFGDSSAIPTFLLSELTKTHVSVALSGDGGDELFAGYERFAAAMALRHYQRVPAPVRNGVRSLLEAAPSGALRGRVGSAQRFAARTELPVVDAYRSWLSYVQEPIRARLLEDPDPWALDEYRDRWERSAGDSVLNRLLRLNYSTYLLDDLLPKVDRMSMAHGLEVRSPFLDRELTEFAFRLPPQIKARGFKLKRVLKHSVSDLLPSELLHRRKQGFGIPLDRWFREDLSAYMRSTLAARDGRVGQYINARAIADLLAEHQSGRRDHSHALWALLTLEVFFRSQGW